MTSVSKMLSVYQKDHGDKIGSVGGTHTEVERVPTGFFSLDMATGGGFPRGATSIIYGPESCLAGETHIHYNVVSASGERQNHKGGTIERLYRRFNGIQSFGKGNYQRDGTRKAVFTAPCMNEEGRIFHNRIEGVVCTGKKHVLVIHTASGLSIRATGEHKFYTGYDYLPASSLAAGSVIMIHNCTPFETEHNPPSERKYLYVKDHPVCGSHTVEDKYHYKRLLRSRAVIEADTNDLSFDDYVARLNAGDLDGLTFLPRSWHVHHLDENTLNDSLDNLEVINPSAHGLLHSTERHNNLRFKVVEDTVVSVTPGPTITTYDIRMESPFNNYVAAGFVVHNSGKTNCALKAIASHQVIWPDLACVFFDIENSFDPDWAAALGVDTEKLIVMKPDYAEQAVDMIEGFLEADDCGMIVLDSVAALMTSKVAEKSAEDAVMGGIGVVMSRLCDKITKQMTDAWKQNKTPRTVIFINQLRVKVGIVYGNPETMVGGSKQKFLSAMTIRVSGKNIMDNKVSKVLPILKETQFVIQKWKCPIVAINGMFSMVTQTHKGLAVGECDDWNTVAAQLKNLGLLIKEDKGGWSMYGVAYPTLVAAREKFYADKGFSLTVKQALIKRAIESGGVPTEADEDEV